MKFTYDQLMWFIIYEIIAVAVIVLIVYLARGYLNFKERRSKDIYKKIRAVLSNAIAKGSATDKELTVPRSHLKPAILLDALYDEKKENDSPDAPAIMAQFTKINLIGFARKYVNNKNWKKRLRAAQIFSYHSEKQDEDNIVKLINDRVPLILLHTTTAALRNPSDKIMRALINRTANERRLSLSLFLNVMKRSHKDIGDMIINVMNSETDPYKRVAAYKMLMQLNYKYDLDVTKDITSNNIELRLAAIKYLASSQEQKSTDTLLKLLGDKDWQVRVVSLQSIAKFDGKKHISEISKLLSDSEWWVRNNAAEALLSMGDIGIKQLSSIQQSDDKYAFEAAQKALESTRI